MPVGRKKAATLDSTGTRGGLLPPAEACHGDGGRGAPEGVGLAISNCGQTEDLVRLLGPIRRVELVSRRVHPSPPVRHGL